ncbi:MAG TPA: GAF and ANTAR domain-containing protein [Actinomycetota bacterium]|nr:GAF and ANTAR domain-containing protein [Actinomycetota bacterium]
MGYDELTHSLTALSTLLLKEETLESTLERVAQLAADLLLGADAASVTNADTKGPFRTASSTHDAVADLDASQYRLGEGPCLAAIRERQVFQIDSMRDESRWERFCALATEAGIASVLAVPLAVPLAGDSVLGAINFYARQANAFSDTDRSLASLFSAQAAVAAANAVSYADAQAERALLARRLQDALHSRAVIDQAVGILMERERLTPEDAFQMLRSASQKLNVKLRVIAAEIVESTRGPLGGRDFDAE